MSVQEPAAASWNSGLRRWALPAGCFAGVMLLFFSNSFDPDLTLFSNDGPLGALASQQWSTANGFTGIWTDLNWIGSKAPGTAPNITACLSLLFGPVQVSKFLVPLALLILAFSSWLLCRQLSFPPAVSALGGIAMALNTDPFSHACWGLASVALSMACYVLALAAVASRDLKSWIRLPLAGMAVALSIMEGFDVGAILSLYVAAFAVAQAYRPATALAANLTRGAVWVAVIACVAALTAMHTLSGLIGTQIKGVAGMQQDAATRRARWDSATQWSLPKLETVRLVIPGLFGYRMDTPNGGGYWGGVGRQPGWEQHHQGLVRHSGSGIYAGVSVVFFGLWAIVQSMQRKQSVFSPNERRMIWFWALAALISLLLSFGRHAPFYQVVYALPFFSTIRNPIKFIHPLSVALVILFGYGLQGLSRQYLEAAKAKLGSLGAQLKSWWPSAASSEKLWTKGSMAVLIVSLLGGLLYASSKRDLERYLGSVNIDPKIAPQISIFSIKEFGWFVLFLGMTAGLAALIQSGWLSGKRAKWAILLLGALLVTDFSHANQPWVVYYNFKERYQSNPVLDVLRKDPQEHRVAARLHPTNGPYLAQPNTQEGGLLIATHSNWLEHLFQYYNIQSLDIIQMPRTPEFDAMFLSAFTPTNDAQAPLIGRLWQLTNTRFLLGMQQPYLDLLNKQIDPTGKGFRVHSPFALTLRQPGKTSDLSLDDFTAVPSPTGPYAIFEFDGALPRASLYSNWLVATNDQTALRQLSDLTFDPSRSVVVSDLIPEAQTAAGTNPAGGTVKITSYAPKRVQLEAKAPSPAVLLLNDRYDPDWRVFVDGKPELLLRCNFIMRGVRLQAGEHTVEFRFEPPVTALYASLFSLAVGLGLCGFATLSGQSRLGVR
ncbi:MAG: hypothetical protein HY735_37290 [Verrucomicrobia bacterium]|nr:hypothetical protein [Verrucomicrobiota bacterium]